MFMCTMFGVVSVLIDHVARVAVHFQSIVEKLTPNDTTFTFIASSQLKDSALSSACSLHTASASVKSSSDSLRQKGLAEIAEDAQENQLGIGDDQGINGGSVHSIGSEDTKARTLKPEEFIDEQRHRKARSTGHNLSPTRSTRTLRNTNKALPPTPPESGLERKENKISVEGKFDNGHNLETRSSFQSSRPSTRDNHSTYGYKHKVKLGPRPSLDSVNRPLPADSSRDTGTRPVSTLPSNIRLPGRRTAPVRKRSQQSQQLSNEKVHTRVSLSPPLPVVPIQTIETPSRIKLNGLVTPVRAEETKSQAVTPEKRRLMKALQLRQKQMAARVSPKPLETVPSLPKVGSDQHKNFQTATDDSPNPRKDVQRVSGLPQHEAEESETVQIVFRNRDESNPAIVESSPISILEPSDGTSTQASSITDEEEVPIIKVNEPGSVLEPVSVRTLDQLPESKDPHEVPLPPIDDDEVISLSRCINSSEEENASSKTLNPAIEYTTLVAVDFNHSQNCEEDFDATRPSTGDAMEGDRANRVSRQHDRARSVRRVSSPANSDDHFLSDDSFMEELGSATVQEAKPISVSKSPITPFFPRYPAEQHWIESARKPRSISGPLNDGNRDEVRQLSPETRPVLPYRSVSASQPVTVQSPHASPTVLKKVGVSTGISQRIKALEKLSSRPTSPSALGNAPVVSPGTPPASVSLRKASLPIPQVNSDRGKTNGKSSRQKMLSSSPSPSPEAVSLGPTDQLSDIRAPSRSQKPRPESISVTATIIRDPRNLMPAVPVDPSVPSTIDLYKSPLMVEHQSGEMSASPVKSTSKFNATRSASSSSAERKSDPPQSTSRDSFASRRSTPSRRGSEVDLPRSVSDTSSSGLTGPDGITEDKKESRKSRLFKRMSNISSASRRSIVYAFNSPVKEQPIVEHHEPTYQPPPEMAGFGDVNIQFPDTLVGLLSLVI